MRRLITIVIALIVIAFIAVVTLNFSRKVASGEEDHAGYVLARQGRLDEALLKFRRSIQLDANNATAHNNLGYYLFKKGQMQEAEVECRESLRLRPNYSEAHDSLGDVLAHTGRLSEAFQECQEAVRLKPSAAHYKNLGYVLYKQGQKDQARSLWHKAAAMDDPEAAAEAQQYLTQYR